MRDMPVPPTLLTLLVPSAFQLPTSVQIAGGSRPLLQQAHHLLRKTEAVDVAADGGTVGVNHLLAVEYLPLDPDPCGAQGPDATQVLDNLVVTGVGRWEVLGQVLKCPAEELPGGRATSVKPFRHTVAAQRDRLTSSCTCP